MHLLSVVSLASVLAVTLAGLAQPAPFSGDAEIDYINDLPGVTWKAGRNFRPDESSRFRRLLNVDLKASRLYNKLHAEFRENKIQNDLPESFDAREKWANCPTINDIRDQANCGSCWAFAAVETLSDRICINNGTTVRLSAQDLTSCCTVCDFEAAGGCGGVYVPMVAWDSMKSAGVVSGGSWGSKKGCMPYLIEPCDEPGANCTGIADTPACTSKCIEGYPKSYQQDKYFAKNGYAIEGVTNIMQEIYDNGPVEAAYQVYTDFQHYKSGVYKHVSGRLEGGHAVKIIGWGVEDGTDYWLVANSWGNKFGLNGYFKIVRGVDECEFESHVIAGEPRK